MPFEAPEEAVQAAETALGRRFPEVLRRRYLEQNGGDLVVGGEIWQLHPVWSDATRRTIQSTSNHVLRETDEARGWRGFPEEAVAVASDGGGNYIVLLPGSDELWDWDHETRELTLAGLVTSP